jgi:hypothetical protein
VGGGGESATERILERLHGIERRFGQVSASLASLCALWRTNGGYKSREQTLSDCLDNNYLLGPKSMIPQSSKRASRHLRLYTDLFKGLLHEEMRH